MYQEYLTRALDLANKRGAHNLSREELCRHLGIPPGSFAHVMGVSYREFMERVVERLPVDRVMTGATRMHPGLRRRQILAHAIELSRTYGYCRITAQQVADAAGTCRANLARLYGMAELRKAVVQWAIDSDDKQLLAQARDAKDPLL